MRLNLFLATFLTMPFPGWCTRQLCPWEIGGENSNIFGFTMPGNRECVTLIRTSKSRSANDNDFSNLARTCLANYINGRLLYWSKLWPLGLTTNENTLPGRLPKQSKILVGIWIENIQFAGKEGSMDVNYVTGEKFHCTYEVSEFFRLLLILPMPYILWCDVFWLRSAAHDIKVLKKSDSRKKYCLYYDFSVGSAEKMFGSTLIEACPDKVNDNVLAWCVHEKGKFSAVKESSDTSYHCAENHVLPFCQHTNITSCNDHKCAENSKCVEPNGIGNGRSCNCSSGLDDLACYKAPKLNPCQSSPCGLFGHCKSLQNGNYHCECKDGKKLINTPCIEVGLVCSPIGGHPCKTPDGCIPFNSTYSCACKFGLADRRCYKSIPCISNPCGDGATCVDRGPNYLCHCADGSVKRQRCTDVHPHCRENICLPDGECIGGDETYVCSCAEGVSHPKCYERTKLPCLSNPCGEYGKCVVRYRPLKFECHCHPGKTGTLCKEDIDMCRSNPCYGSSKCVNEDNDFKCICAPGFTGRLCNQNIDDCHSNPCVNKGTCYDGINEYVCRCSPGYTGQSCEKDIDECESNPCLNNGTCINKLDAFECECRAPYHPPICAEREQNACDVQPCRNGGTCKLIGSSDSYTCDCVDGFVGYSCEFKRVLCTSLSCNHGSCTQGRLDYNCTCEVGYTGHACNEEIDECLTEACENGGTCQDEVNGISCKCPEEWTGTRCEEEINECQEDQCDNNGTCIKRTGECECTHGYTGTFCEIIPKKQGSLESMNIRAVLLIGVGSTVVFIVLMAALCSAGQKRRRPHRGHSRSTYRSAPRKIRRFKTYIQESTRRTKSKWRRRTQGATTKMPQREGSRTSIGPGSSYTVPKRRPTMNGSTRT